MNNFDSFPLHRGSISSHRVKRARLRKNADHGGFSILEIMTTVAVIAALVTVGLIAAQKWEEASDASKLRNDVFALNRAVQVFRVSGGSVDEIVEVGDVINRLKSVLAEAEKEEKVGFRGLMIDRRITPVMMTEEEQATAQPRAIWVAEERRFEIVTTGPGVKEFALGEVTEMTEGVRETSFKYAKTSDWIWDYSDDVSLSRRGFIQDFEEENETPEAPTGNSSSISQLTPPQFSLPGGYYESNLFPLQITLIDPNPPGSSQLVYSLDGTNWHYYSGLSIVVEPTYPAATVVAIAKSLDIDRWIDSDGASEAYETLTFSGSSSGIFGSPTLDEGGIYDATYSIEETETGGSKFTWGVPHVEGGFDQPSTLTFEGAEFGEIIPDIDFVVGTLEYYNSSIHAGTGATDVELDVVLDVEVSIPIQNEDLTFPIELINTENLSYQTDDQNADYVKLSTTSTEFTTASDGTVYYLELRFAESTYGSYTSIDQFHVWEDHSAVGTLVARLTSTPPGEEDTMNPTVVLSTAASVVNSQFEVFANFNEIVSGFTAEDIVVSNGEVSALDGNGYQYQFFVTPTADGQIAIFIPSDAVNDSAGNGNDDSNALIVVADLTGPTGTLTQGSGGGMEDGTLSHPYRISGPSQVTIEFDESALGFSIEDLNLTNAIASDFSGTGDTYTFLLSPSGSEEQISVEIFGNSYSDVLGNAGTDFEGHFLFDGVGPEMVLATTFSEVTGTFQVTATASEPIVDLEESDVQVSNGTVVSVSGAGSDYVIEVSPSNLGDVSVLVPIGSFSDEAGHQNVAASNVVTVKYKLPPFLNFNDYTFHSFSNQDNGTYSIHEGNELRVEANGWKWIPFDYDIQPNTYVEFDFRSTKKGEIQGIAFENDDGLSSHRTIRVFGYQFWGVDDYDNYVEDTGWKQYLIPLGTIITGNIDRLVFIADDDWSGDGVGDSHFRNFRMYQLGE